jgi:hypothetical protein
MPQPSDVFHGLFTRSADKLSRTLRPPASLRDPSTGRELRIATVEVGGAICPSCTQRAEGGFVSFVTDLRLVFACPHCCQLVWINGA